MPTYTTRDESGWETEIKAANFADAEQQARAAMKLGDWSGVSKTFRMNVWIECAETAEEGSITVRIHPDEPKCTKGKSHDWQQPEGLAGMGIIFFTHGAGNIQRSACLNCGCEMAEDSHAENPATGERGLYSIEYTEKAFTEEELAPYRVAVE